MIRKARQVILWLSIFLMLVLAVLNAILSFYPPDPSVIHAYTSSPFYLIPWGLLLILYAIYFFLYAKEKNRIPKFSLTHLSFFLLMIAVLLTFLTNRSGNLTLIEGTAVSYTEIAESLGLSSDSQASIRLDEFSKETLDEEGEKINYRSRISLIESNAITETDIEVNRPLKWKGLLFYQSDWSIAAEDFVVSFRGQEFNLLNDGNFQLLTANSNVFFFYPADLQDERIVYAWELSTLSGSVISNGQFTARTAAEVLPDEWDFSILSEEYSPVSIIEVTYGPFYTLLAVMAILFLFFLAMDFWGWKYLLKRGGRDDS